MSAEVVVRALNLLATVLKLGVRYGRWALFGAVSRGWAVWRNGPLSLAVLVSVVFLSHLEPARRGLVPFFLAVGSTLFSSVSVIIENLNLVPGATGLEYVGLVLPVLKAFFTVLLFFKAGMLLATKVNQTESPIVVYSLLGFGFAGWMVASSGVPDLAAAENAVGHISQAVEWRRALPWSDVAANVSEEVVNGSANMTG